MLDYEWANPSSVILDDGSEQVHGSDPTRNHHHTTSDSSNNNASSILDHYNTTQTAFNNLLPPHPHHHHQSSPVPFFGHHFNPVQAQVHSLFDPGSVFGGASSYAPTHHHSMLSLDPSIPGGHHHQHGFMLVPKSEEDMCRPPVDFASRIGLNLGGRTYFSSEDDFLNRLYHRSRPADVHAPMINVPRCQAEGCNADLSQSKHYHRRHKVCEFHSKSSTVIANGLTQRFCQQCSRFHLLSEFDNGKRSCRKRLADHNRRRRKTHQTSNPENGNNSQQPRLESAPNSSSDNITKSPPESAVNSTSAVTVAVSPPRMGLDCFRPRQYQSTTSSGSSGSLFFSSG